MTTQELINYYADLLIIQYKNQPNAYATVQALTLPTIMDQLPFAVQDAFDIETAVGVQLDVLGKYAGVTRTALTFSGLIVLTDAEYRIMIKMKLVQNNYGSALADIQNLLNTYFPGSIFVFDFKNMRIGYYFDSSLGSHDLAEAFVKQKLLPKPMGVQLSSLIYAATLVDLFGWRTYDHVAVNVTGFNSYSSYNMAWPWLTYADAIAT